MRSRTSAHQDRVLLVEDDVTTRLLMSEYLKKTGYRVDEAGNGVEGLQAFHRYKPDIVVSDVKMPGMNGFEMCTAIQSSRYKTPTILATGLGDADAINQAYDAGATDFITKPINYTILEHRLKYILRAHRNMDALAENQQQLSWAQNVAKMGYWELNTDTYRLFWSPEIFQLLSISPDDFDSRMKASLQMIHPDDRNMVRTQLQKTIQDGVPCNVNHRIVLPNGTEKVINLQARRKLRSVTE